MTKISSLLDQIAKEALRLGIDVDKDMHPGLSQEEQLEATRALPFPLPMEIGELYSWKNGVRIEGQRSEIRIFPEFYFVPIDRCVSTTTTLISLVERPENQWNRAWLSIADDLFGDHLAMNAITGERDFGRIFMLSYLSDPFPAFWSFEAMLAAILECYRAGAYFLDEDGFLEERTEISKTIYEELNHGLSPLVQDQ
jgi:hypothetical protein